MFFEKLNQLALQCPLVLTVTADAGSGRMTVVITPKLDKSVSDGALRQPLTLTATPDEFDAEFFGALDKYRNARLSLQEQADATAEVLDAAKSAQVAKAAKATSGRGTKTTTTKPHSVAEAGTLDSQDDETGDTTTTAESAPASGGATDVSLFD